MGPFVSFVAIAGIVFYTASMCVAKSFFGENFGRTKKAVLVCDDVDVE